MHSKSTNPVSRSCNSKFGPIRQTLARHVALRGRFRTPPKASGRALMSFIRLPHDGAYTTLAIEKDGTHENSPAHVHFDHIVLDNGIGLSRNR